MKFPILNRFTGSLLVEVEIECAADASESVRLGLAIKMAVKTRTYLGEKAERKRAGAELGGTLHGLLPLGWSATGRLAVRPYVRNLRTLVND